MRRRVLRTRCTFGTQGLRRVRVTAWAAAARRALGPSRPASRRKNARRSRCPGFATCMEDDFVVLFVVGVLDLSLHSPAQLAGAVTLGSSQAENALLT